MLTHAELVERACAWLAGTMRMHAIIPELKTWSTSESPDVIAWRAKPGRERYRSDVSSVVVECKASHADFLADKAKPCRQDPSLGMGRYRWYFAEPGVVLLGGLARLPERWGLAEVRARGVRLVVQPQAFPVHNVSGETALLVAALRRVHFPSEKFPPAHYPTAAAATARQSSTSSGEPQDSA